MHQTLLNIGVGLPIRLFPASIYRERKDRFQYPGGGGLELAKTLFNLFSAGSERGYDMGVRNGSIASREHRAGSVAGSRGDRAGSVDRSRGDRSSSVPGNRGSGNGYLAPPQRQVVRIWIWIQLISIFPVYDEDSDPGSCKRLKAQGAAV